MLDLPSVGNVAKRLDDRDKGVSAIHTPGGKQRMTIVNESGLYDDRGGPRANPAVPSWTATGEGVSLPGREAP